MSSSDVVDICLFHCLGLFLMMKMWLFPLIRANHLSAVIPLPEKHMKIYVGESYMKRFLLWILNMVFPFGLESPEFFTEYRRR